MVEYNRKGVIVTIMNSNILKQPTLTTYLAFLRKPEGGGGGDDGGKGRKGPWWGTCPKCGKWSFGHCKKCQ